MGSEDGAKFKVVEIESYEMLNSIVIKGSDLSYVGQRLQTF